MLKRWFLIISLLKKGGLQTMVDVYVTLIILKRRTIEQVPKHLQAVVLTDLKAMGLNGNGEPLTQ